MDGRGCGFFAGIMIAAIVGGALLLTVFVWLENVASPAGIIVVVLLIFAPVIGLLGVLAYEKLTGGKLGRTPTKLARVAAMRGHTASGPHPLTVVASPQEVVGMAVWSEDALAGLDAGDEVEIAARREDGALRRPVTIWGVRVGDDFYVRSAYGPQGGWYRAILASGRGVVSARGVNLPVAAERLEVADPRQSAIDAAYRAKYSRYAENITSTVIGPAAAEVTVRLVPED